MEKVQSQQASEPGSQSTLCVADGLPRAKVPQADQGARQDDAGPLRQAREAARRCGGFTSCQARQFGSTLLGPLVLAHRPEQTAEILQLCGSCTRTDVALHNLVVRSRPLVCLGIGLTRRNVKATSRRSDGNGSKPKPNGPQPAGKAKAKAKGKANASCKRKSDTE